MRRQGRRPMRTGMMRFVTSVIVPGNGFAEDTEKSARSEVSHMNSPQNDRKPHGQEKDCTFYPLTARRQKDL